MTDKVLKGNGKVNGLYYYIYIYIYDKRSIYVMQSAER